MNLKKVFQFFGLSKKSEPKISRPGLLEDPEILAAVRAYNYIDLRTASYEERLSAIHQGQSLAAIENLYVRGLVPREGILPKDRPILNMEQRKVLTRELSNMLDRRLIGANTAGELWMRAVGVEIESTVVKDVLPRPDLG